MTHVQLVYCTCPNEEAAETLAKAIVGEKLAACVNIVPGIRSIYSWKGEICDDSESLLLIKTTADRFAALKERLISLHPYECPEVIATEISDGNKAYIDWLTAQTRDAS